MVRYTLALRGVAKDAASDIEVTEKEVDIIKHKEQLSEEFLCEINADGQVPVLTGGELKRPLPDSLDITFYIAELFPDLMPSAHHQEITSFLKELHGLNFFSLTFEGQQERTKSTTEFIRRRMEEEIAQRYRDALTAKLELFTKSKIGGLEPEVVREMVGRAKSLLEKLEQLLARSAPDASGTVQGEERWLFGTAKPTALDAHVIVFVRRLQDIGRETLVPKKLLDWAEQKMEKTEWKELMQGRSTMFGG